MLCSQVWTDRLNTSAFGANGLLTLLCVLSIQDKISQRKIGAGDLAIR